MERRVGRAKKEQGLPELVARPVQHPPIREVLNLPDPDPQHHPEDEDELWYLGSVPGAWRMANDIYVHHRSQLDRLKKKRAHERRMSLKEEALDAVSRRKSSVALPVIPNAQSAAAR